MGNMNNNIIIIYDMMIFNMYVIISIRYQICNRVSIIEYFDQGEGVKGLEDVVLDEVSDLKMDFSKRDGEAASVTYQVLRKRLSQLSTKERRSCISYLQGRRGCLSYIPGIRERLPQLPTW